MLFLLEIRQVVQNAFELISLKKNVLRFLLSLLDGCPAGVFFHCCRVPKLFLVGRKVRLAKDELYVLVGSLHAFVHA